MRFLPALLLFTLGATPLWAISPGNYEKTLKVDGEQREFRLHIPKCFDGCTRLPVVIVFHGMSANAKLIQKLTDLDELADKCGFITVYPNGTGFGPVKGFKAGNTKRSEQRKSDDVKFVHRILNYLERATCSDSSRVYATGLSNGAMMCYRLATEMPHRIAAIAPISGSLGTECRRPSCPVSVMHFHGTSDGVLPFCGPKEAKFFEQSYFSAPQAIKMFACAANCVDSLEITELPNKCNDGTLVRLHSYENQELNIEVILVKIVGGGHQWPQKKIPLRYLGTATQEINANEMMWCFFQRHTVSPGCCK